MGERFAVEWWVEGPEGSFTYHLLHAHRVRVTPVDERRHPDGEPVSFPAAADG